MSVEFCDQCGAEMTEKTDHFDNTFYFCPVCGSEKDIENDKYTDEEEEHDE